MINLNPDSSALVVLSGGQDSTTCMYWALKHFSRVVALTFHYGQKHALEVDLAPNTRRWLPIACFIVRCKEGAASQSSSSLNCSTNSFMVGLASVISL